MKRLPALLLAAVCAAAPAAAATRLAYPPAPRGAVTENFFGTTVADPYRWMEDLDAPQTQTWVREENALSRSYLDAIPERPAIRDRFRTLVNYEKIGAPRHEGRWWYYSHNTGLQNQNVLFRGATPTDPGTVFFDPNTLSSDGTVSLGPTSFTEDGKLWAYATQSSGSDWETWHVRDTATGRDLPDVVNWSKFSGATWLRDEGFYYNSYDRPANGNLLSAVGAQKVFYHRLGTPQSTDRLVFTRPSCTDCFVGVEASEDGRWEFLTVGRGTNPENELWVRRAGSQAAWKPLFTKRDAQYAVIGNDGPVVYLLTSAGAPRKRIASVDVDAATPSLRPIVAERDQPIEGVSLLRKTFFVGYLKDAHTAVERYDLAGRDLGAMEVPGIGTLSPVGASHRNESVAFYSFTSYTSPGTIYRYDAVNGTSSVFRQPKIAFDESRYTTDQVFATSKDGTRVPLFIAHRRDVKLDGTNPTILYGYGGFDISLTPSFSFVPALWMEMGGVYAVANLRGGGEYGEAWHEAGRLDRKQNVFDDFYAAAHYLIDQHWTSTPRLAASGGSNGGLLVGAAITQHPELWGAALPAVGVMDMLRFQKFTAGKAWVVEYGSADASEAQFRTLLAYSPYNNVKDGTHYPPTLITTADHDDRVYPSHSFKFAAAMQHAQAGDAPILISIETKAGHGGGKPLSKVIEETADAMAFLVKNLDFRPTL